jgi:hypothetical protein
MFGATFMGVQTLACHSITASLARGRGQRGARLRSLPPWPPGLGPFGPYHRYHVFCTQTPPVPGPPVIMHCSNEMKAQLLVVVEG